MFLERFWFATDRYDFWPVYDAIKNYYPLGVQRQHGGIYFDYPGVKRLRKIIEANVHDNNVFNKKWVKLDNKVKAVTNFQPAGTMEWRHASVRT